MSMNHNPAEVYFVKDRIESNEFQIANYLDLANTVYLRIFIKNVKNILKKWASIRIELKNFPSYADANLFN